MVEERQELFQAKFGFKSDGMASCEYLTRERLIALEAKFAIEWKTHRVWYGFQWAMRPWIAKLRQRREPSQFCHLCGQGEGTMIILFNPRATKPRNRRFPLSVMALAAVLEGREEYQIVDGNIDDNPTATILELIRHHNVELLGVSVMPGPQMVAAMATSREIRSQCPKLPIVWGGYFPSIYCDAALNARYVDYVVRGQGEETLVELIDAIAGEAAIRGHPGIVLQGCVRFASAQPREVDEGARCIPLVAVPPCSC